MELRSTAGATDPCTVHRVVSSTDTGDRNPTAVDLTRGEFGVAASVEPCKTPKIQFPEPLEASRASRRLLDVSAERFTAAPAHQMEVGRPGDRLI